MAHQLRMQLRQVVMRHRRIQVVLDVVIDVVREQQRTQRPGDEVGARGGERRGKVRDRAVLSHRAQAQNCLDHRSERQQPQHQVFDAVARVERDCGHDQVEGDHAAAIGVRELA